MLKSEDPACYNKTNQVSKRLQFILRAKKLEPAYQSQTGNAGNSHGQGLVGSLNSYYSNGNNNSKKAIGIHRLARQQVCMYITLFCTFLCSHWTTTMWNFLISHFVEDANTRQWLSFSFSKRWYSPLEFTSRKICQQFWGIEWDGNKCDQV